MYRQVFDAPIPVHSFTVVAMQSHCIIRLYSPDGKVVSETIDCFESDADALRRIANTIDPDSDDDQV